MLKVLKEKAVDSSNVILNHLKKNTMKKIAKNIPVQGTISVNFQGFGFVKGDDDLSVFIPPRMLRGAITGDTVEVSIDPQSDPHRPAGAVKRIIQRKFSEFVGCLVPTQRGWAIRPLRHEMPGILMLTEASVKRHKRKLVEGNWAKAVLPIPDEDDESSGCGKAELKECLAQSGDVTADLNAIVAEYGLPEQYTDKEEAAAAALEPAKVKRLDCRELCCVTIDPVDALDYDDALSCEPGDKPGELVVGVHIADVACYVKRGSVLDKKARRRGFTSYLPGRTIPMLPRALANKQCSLQAGEERLAHTVFIHVDVHNGEILRSERCHTLIKVRQRLCYEQVQRYFDGEPFEAEDGVLELVSRLNDVAQQLRRKRAREERFLPMSMPEIRVVCSENPSNILGMQATEDNPSHQLVEEFMLAANECVARELIMRSIPGIYRNHLQPDQERLEEFVETATIMLGQKVKSIFSRSGMVRFLKMAEKSPLRDVLCMAFLRHLPRADYGAECLGHFGLGKEIYCHFTSPIRRYTDTLIHQQLLAIDNKRKTYDLETIAALAAQCTSLEYNCDQASFAASDRMKIRYIAQQLEDDPELRLRGEVCNTTRNGASIYLPKYGLLAFVNAPALPPGWRFDALKLEWHDRYSDETIFVTQDRLFSVVTADPVRGELTLLPALEVPKRKKTKTKGKTQKQTKSQKQKKSRKC